MLSAFSANYICNYKSPNTLHLINPFMFRIGSQRSTK